MGKKMFFDRPDACYFVPDPREAAAYCRKNWPEDVDHILRVADEVCRNYFLFDLNWDMERTYDPVVFEGEINWSIKPKGDPEFVWQFNRHRFFICLGQAYWLTGDEKYVKGFLRLINDWMDRVPLNEANWNGPWRMLETGLRGESWTKAIRYFRDSDLITEGFLDRFADCLRIHAKRLVEQGGDARLQSNWCVLENSGLFEIALALPQDEQTKEWIRIALDRLDRSSMVQVHADGSQWEQSPMYHNEVFHCLCCCVYLARINGIALPDGMEERVHRMARVDLIWRKPDRHQFTQGDSDDTDLGDVLSMGAYLFQDPELKYAGFEKLDFEDAWDFGKTAWESYDALASRKPDFTSAALADSGNYYLRSDWSEKANLLHFTCGGVSTGHCHGDKLHVSLVINGEDVLIDGGRGTYMDVPLRFMLKDNPGHNTTTVDGKSFTTFQSSWYTEHLSLAVNRVFYQGKTAEYIQGGHLGYIDDGIFVNRRVIWIKPDVYLVCDEFYAQGEHTFRQFFHFSPEGMVNVQENRVSFSGEHTDAFFTFLADGVKLEAGKGVCSSHYNQSEENPMVTAVRQKEGFASMITVINGGQKGKTQPAAARLLKTGSHSLKHALTEREAQAVEITLEDKSYVVTICHDEIYHTSDAVITESCQAGRKFTCYATGGVCVFETTDCEDGVRIYGGEVLQA
ncbi:MAG TPA: heparinase II/III family protein [Candidatus Eisenbergiella merdipullorum]|uniref:Heparinase II/III family protein n=1 Tax=Candidatus Eisenbergiella merdipullorum TaxID=2838553 RepID=A0A9D2L1Q3_9FIRM|nr:heparinase II/III family protein [Candidatus Eisenbergiella merdipullorum]